MNLKTYSKRTYSFCINAVAVTQTKKTHRKNFMKQLDMDKAKENSIKI